MTIPPSKGKGKVVQWLRDHVAYAGDGCLTFPFSRNPEKGYGAFGLNGKQFYAHRFMCELVNGPPPSPDHQASHLCGMGHEGCVHPLHLAWKTNTENQKDRRTHGTARKRDGIRAKLTPEQIAEVRALKGKVTQYDLARRFGVKPGCIEYWQKHNNPPATMTKEAVLAVREYGAPKSFSETARRFGLNPEKVRRILKGQAYKIVA